MAVPPFAMYFPSESNLHGDDQRAFFGKLISRLERGEYLDVEGNISYVFLYLYTLLERGKASSDLEGLSDRLIRIGELYADEERVASYCANWACECLLVLHRYDEYLEKSEPASALGNWRGVSNMRLNVQRWTGRDADPVDVLLASGRKRISPFIQSHEPVYREKLVGVMTDFAAGHGGWFRLFDTWGCRERRSVQYLFSGSRAIFDYEIDLASYSALKQLDIVEAMAREAETRARVSLGLPGVGEGWIAETELFRRVKAEFAETSVIQHGRPPWLGMQHFDVWLPHWRIAVEYHGRQHFEPVAFFGGAEAYELTVERDRRKSEVAQREGVVLLVVTEADDVKGLFARIRQIRTSQLAAIYRATVG